MPDFPAASTLWQQFAAFAQGNPAAFAISLAAVAAVTAATAAIVAAVLTPWIAARTIRKQGSMAMVAGNRQAWIDGLRDDLAELFEILTWLVMLEDTDPQSGDDHFRYLAEKQSRIHLLINRVRLRLNPREEPSRDLTEAIAVLHANAYDRKERQFQDTLEGAMAKAQKLLKAEWLRIRNGA